VTLADQLDEARTLDDYIWRGMIVKLPAALAKKMRSWINQYEGLGTWDEPEDNPPSPRELASHLGNIGSHWSFSLRIAERFATTGMGSGVMSVGMSGRRGQDAVGGRGNKFGIILRAKKPSVGKSGGMFSDEAEFTLPKGTPIQVVGIKVYKPSRAGDWHFLAGSATSDSRPTKVILKAKA
jgi:hypothetical protein